MGREIDVRGLRIHLREWGPEDGEPVVLLHGIPGSGYMWRRVGPALGDAGFRVVAPDLPCTGRSEMSPKADVGVDDDARLVRSLLDELGIDAAHAVGAGIGGCVAQVFAARFGRRSRSLTLVGSGGDMNWPRPGVVNLQELAERDDLTTDLVSKELPRMLQRGSANGLPDAVVDAYVAPHLTEDGVMALGNLLLDLDPRDTADVEDALPDYDKPVLLLWGEADEIQPLPRLDWFREIWPEARVHVVEGSGHLVAEDDPDALVEHLLSFLRTVSAKRPEAARPTRGS